MLEARIRAGSNVKAGKLLGITRQTVDKCMRCILHNAVKQGYSPEHDMTKTVPEGFHVQGISSYYGEDGQLRGQWVKSQADREAEQQILEDVLKERFSCVKPLAKIAAPRKKLLKDLVNVIVLSDAHIGLYAWAEETGVGWNLKTARQMIVGAVKYLIDAAPPCEEALIANLGDYIHTDNKSYKTTSGSHPLDVDGRWAEVVAVGVDALVSCIDFALAKHKTVRVINQCGNHDYHTAIMMNIGLSMAYKNNPRVILESSAPVYNYVRYGKVLVGITHGDKRIKPDELPLVMAADRPGDWGDSLYRYWYTGHLHHQRKFEPTGSNCTIETFRIMAGRDAWHQGQGYRAGREMQSIILHRDFGETARNVVTPDMLRQST